MKTLERLFGNTARVKIMRLFLFNPEKVYDVEEVSIRAKVKRESALREMLSFQKMGLLTKKAGWHVVHSKTKSKKANPTSKRVKFSGWSLDESFPYLIPLQNLLINLSTIKDEYLISRLSQGGKAKLVILAGIFIEDPSSRIDILVVGDKLHKKVLDGVVKGLEAEIGKELRYAAFDTADFKYRVSMYDKLVRDILDYPHKKILNKLGV